MELEMLGEGKMFLREVQSRDCCLFYLLGEANLHVIPLKDSSCVFFLWPHLPSTDDCAFAQVQLIHILHNVCTSSEGNIQCVGRLFLGGLEIEGGSNGSRRWKGALRDDTKSCELHRRAEATCCSVIRAQKPYVGKGRCSVG